MLELEGGARLGEEVHKTLLGEPCSTENFLRAGIACSSIGRK